MCIRDSLRRNRYGNEFGVENRGFGLQYELERRRARHKWPGTIDVSRGITECHHADAGRQQAISRTKNVSAPRPEFISTLHNRSLQEHAGDRGAGVVE